jgi:hypothetical protein
LLGGPLVEATNRSGNNGAYRSDNHSVYFDGIVAVRIVK